MSHDTLTIDAGMASKRAHNPRVRQLPSGSNTRHLPTPWRVALFIGALAF